MTNENKKVIKELESSLDLLLRGSSDSKDKHRRIDNAYDAHLSFDAPDTDSKKAEYCILHKDEITKLRSLYQRKEYLPAEDENTLSYLFRDGMSTEEKLKALADALWCTSNSGYSDAMANRLMAGQEDAQTQLWEQNCRNKRAIDRYYQYLNEITEST